jgi:exodeoxyribonuclease-3
VNTATILSPQQNERRNRYVLGVVRAIRRCASLIQSQPTVLLGDFNSNTFWDRLYPRDANHTALVQRLHELGCVSAYHHFFGEEHGAESRPTYFHYNHGDKPYHLDYCFVPRAWTPRIRRILVGKHDQWRRWSDHRPVVVDLSDLH